MSLINLFCLPYAGGSLYSYNNYAKSAPGHIKVIPVEIPGRGSRYKEKLLTDLESVIDDIFEQIRDRIHEPYGLYGHSMGTLLGFMLTKRIIQENLNKPLHLFFTGCVAPSVDLDEPIRYLLPKAEFITTIRELGGCPDEILEDNDLMNFFEPILRADFQAVETYKYCETNPFDVPIDIMIGTEEKFTYKQALQWQKETTAKVEVRQFPGKHFFIFDYHSEIMKIMTQKLTKYPVL